MCSSPSPAKLLDGEAGALPFSGCLALIEVAFHLGHSPGLLAQCLFRLALGLGLLLQPLPLLLIGPALLLFGEPFLLALPALLLGRHLGCQALLLPIELLLGLALGPLAGLLVLLVGLVQLRSQ